MKIRVTLKDPDGFYDSVQEAVRESIAGPGFFERELKAMEEVRIEETWEKLEKFVEYHEYINIEFDTEAGTAIVVPRKP